LGVPACLPAGRPDRLLLLLLPLQWHLGFRTVENLPVSRGFDTFFGLLAGGADHYNKALEACGGDGHNCSCGNISSTALPFRIDYYDAPHGAPGAPAKDLWDDHTFDAYAYSDRAGSLVAVRKQPLKSHLYTNAIILPRQARDKRRESSNKTAVSSGARHCVALLPVLGTFH
jgi:hypothetical protein